MSMREDPSCDAIVRLPPRPRFERPRLVALLPALLEAPPLAPDRLVLGAAVWRARERFLLAERILWNGTWFALGLVGGFAGGILVALHAGRLS